jgi:hypothetical protein
VFSAGLINHLFLDLEACAGDCCKQDRRQLSLQDRINELGGPGRSISFGLAVSESVVLVEPVFVRLGGKPLNFFKYLQDVSLQMIPECFRRGVS